MTASTDNPILEKIRKLLSKAEGTDNELEANTFFSKAQELMEKYAIDEALARQRPGQTTSFNITSQYFTLESDTAAILQAQRKTLNVISKANRCHSFYTDHAGKVMQIVGTEADIRFVLMLFHSILVQMDREMLKGFQSESANPTTPQNYIPGQPIDFLAEAAQIDPTALKAFTKRTYRPEFIVGYLKRVRERINEAHDNREAVHTNSMALVVRDSATAVKDYLDDNGINVRVSTRNLAKYTTNEYARNAGANAANRADLGNSKLSNNRKELT